MLQGDGVWEPRSICWRAHRSPWRRSNRQGSRRLCNQGCQAQLSCEALVPFVGRVRGRRLALLLRMRSGQTKAGREARFRACAALFACCLSGLRATYVAACKRRSEAEEDECESETRADSSVLPVKAGGDDLRLADDRGCVRTNSILSLGLTLGSALTTSI